MKKEYLKIFFPFFIFFSFFLFWTGNQNASGSYQYEGEAFYAKTNPSGYVTEGISFYAYGAETEGTSPIFRLYNPRTGNHFYTRSSSERDSAISNHSYVSEGTAFYAYPDQNSGKSPVYRFYSSLTGDHFYTASEGEKSSVQNNPQWGYTYEGIAFYVSLSQESETSPVYRFYSPSTGDHFYTASENEANSISLYPIYRFYAPSTGDHFYSTNKSIPQGYLYEGIAFYAFKKEMSENLPIFQLYNSQTGDHLYTRSSSERDSAISNHSYVSEGTAFYAYPEKNSGNVPVYRFYNGKTGDHFYTASEIEKNVLQRSELGEEISVGLWAYSRSAIKDSPFKISANKSYNIKNENGNIIGQVSGQTETRVTYDSDSYLRAYGSISSTKSRKVLYFDAADGDNSTLIFDVNRPNSSYDQYRGKIKIQYTDSSNIWVINTLPLEHYAWGAGEFTGTGPFEHTKTMSVIFRTYGYWYIQYATKYNVYGFKIKSDSGNQIYRGYDWETAYANVKKAAQETRGTIVSYGNNVALTPYSSWSDGRTRSFEERWGSKSYPWCKSVSDPYGKNSTMSTSQLEAAGNHMVGLIANGSLKLAGSSYNWDYQRILKYYYTGIGIGPKY